MVPKSTVQSDLERRAAGRCACEHTGLGAKLNAECKRRRVASMSIVGRGNECTVSVCGVTV